MFILLFFKAYYFWVLNFFYGEENAVWDLFKKLSKPLLFFLLCFVGLQYYLLFKFFRPLYGE